VQNPKFKILGDLLIAQEWEFRVRLAGERLQVDGVEFNLSADKLRSATADSAELEKQHLYNNSKMNADVYYFALSLANYIKAIEELPEDLIIEKFSSLKVDIVSIRNIKEHWEDNNLEKLLSGGLSDRSKQNFKVFLERANDFPVLPFWLLISKEGEVTISGSIEVGWILTKIFENNRVITEYNL